jgi:hypothetical protein
VNVYVAWSLVAFVVATAVLAPFLGVDSRDAADWTPGGRPEEGSRIPGRHPHDGPERRPERPADLAADVFAAPRPIRLPRPRRACAPTRVGRDI